MSEHFVWNGRRIGTLTDLLNAMLACETSGQANALKDAYRVFAPKAADEDMGWVLGDVGTEERKRLRKMFGVTHPVFGDKDPTPDEAFQMGMEWGKRSLEKDKLAVVEAFRRGLKG